MGNTRQLGRAQAAAAFNLERAGGEGERGLRPLPLAGSDRPLPLNTRAPASAAPPSPAALGAAGASCGPEFGYSWSRAATLRAAGMLWNPTRDTSQRRAPGGGAVLAAACLAWLGFRGRARLLPSVVGSRSDEKPSLGLVVRVKGLKRTASEFSALFRAQPANFPNMSHHRLVSTLRLIVQALREPILSCQTLRLRSNRPQRADLVHATFKEKKSPVALSQGWCLGIRKKDSVPPPSR